MSTLFAGKTAWITGASSGIGAGLARALSARGAKILLSGRNEAELKKVAEGCKGAQRLAFDMAELDQLPVQAAAATELLGHVDFLFLNAGVSQRSLARDTGLDVVQRLIHLNTFAQIGLAKAVLPQMRERGSGHFVLTSSVLGLMAVPGRSGYCASKHALHGYFNALRAEESPSGLRVTIACPGYVATRLSINALTADGTPQGTMDRHTAAGFTADACAEEILDGVARGRDQLVIAGAREKFGLFVNKWCPALFRRMATKFPPTDQPV